MNLENMLILEEWKTVNILSTEMQTNTNTLKRSRDTERNTSENR